jgi:hypothetical protein
VQVLTIDDFAPHLNTEFTAALQDGEIAFTLVEARPMPVDKRFAALRAPFSLLFRNHSALIFPQQTYMVRHASMGDFALFLVPIARDATGFVYQAVFN